MTFICYPKCTTCQKAQKWLDENGISYTFRDIKTQNPAYEELSAWHRRSGLPLKKFFNTSGLLYKSMAQLAVKTIGGRLDAIACLLQCRKDTRNEL
jgi:arsenate reductase